ncbi:GerMN domain-containing protein [Paenibacillus sp. MMS20-IR301]|uniref:GerMN domain-containing protein n=1 Tax=Paenibacillus sp. MMS20-IR301 TaxID=2895946 RepID=UPI0028E3DF72|nr:GerMN domain-containing protein [Paenibacillus sp. MMS20-IR301]WNS44552.1 GerMN domain-containing protein [Paenibacillus sp. MMS20-IR301]
MNKKWIYTGAAVLLLLVISGCGDKPAAAPADSAGQVVSGAEGNADSGGNNTPAATSTPEPAPPAATEAPAATEKPAEPAKQSQTIQVYYTDPQQSDLVAAEVQVSFTDDKEKFTEAFKALQNSSNADQIPLWGKIELKSLEFSNGQIVLDVHKPDEAQLGAGGEALAISALSQTFFQFAEVKNIDVLVDGEQVDSLMGHVDLVHPMTRENNGL